MNYTHKLTLSHHNMCILNSSIYDMQCKRLKECVLQIISPIILITLQAVFTFEVAKSMIQAYKTIYQIYVSVPLS